MATFFKRKSDVPGWWRDAADHWWTGPGWYEGGLDESQGAYPTPVAAPAASTATTPTELERTMDWSQTSQIHKTPLTYQALKDAGMWDLADPNSQTWQWIDERYGSGLGGHERPRAQALALALFDLKVPESEYAAAFQGVSQEELQQVQAEIEAINKRREEAAKDQDWTEKYLEPLVNPLTLAALAFGYLPGAVEAGTAAGAAGAAGATGSVSGAELASLIEAGTAGFEGAALEAAALSGGSAIYSTATGALQGLGSATGVTPFDPGTDFTSQAMKSALDNPIAQPSASLVKDVTGVTTNPNELLVADSGQTMTDVGPGLLDGEATGITDFASEGFGSGEAGMYGGADGLGVGFGAGSPAAVTAGASPGIIDSVLQWGSKNPLLASTALQLTGGIIGGIGNNITANDIADKNIQAAKELQEMKLQQEKELLEWKRRFTQEGSYFDARVPIRPGANKQLRRPDGTPVYAPGGGLISSQMTG